MIEDAKERWTRCGMCISCDERLTSLVGRNEAVVVVDVAGLILSSHRGGNKRVDRSILADNEPKIAALSSSCYVLVSMLNLKAAQRQQ
jgi:hypothetical protein